MKLNIKPLSQLLGNYKTLLYLFCMAVLLSLGSELQLKTEILKILSQIQISSYQLYIKFCGFEFGEYDGVSWLLQSVLTMSYELPFGMNYICNSRYHCSNSKMPTC